MHNCGCMLTDWNSVSINQFQRSGISKRFSKLQMTGNNSDARGDMHFPRCSHLQQCFGVWIICYLPSPLQYFNQKCHVKKTKYLWEHLLRVARRTRAGQSAVSLYTVHSGKTTNSTVGLFFSRIHLSPWNNEMSLCLLGLLASFFLPSSLHLYLVVAPPTNADKKAGRKTPLAT